MVRIVGGIILMKIGFELFSSSPSGGGISRPVVRARCKYCVCAARDAAHVWSRCDRDHPWNDGHYQTVLDQTARSFCRHRGGYPGYNVCDLFVPGLCKQSFEKAGPMGIDAITRIVGFFVSAMGVALIFDGVIEALETHGVTALH